MRAPIHGTRLLSALAAAALLGACGSGLYDAAGVPQVDGGGTTCDPNNANAILCTVGGVPDTCTDSNVSHCGQACTDCSATQPPVTNGTIACLGTGPAATCGYTCGTGFFKCTGGCCTAQAVAAAERSTCALLSSGEVACWGANDTGQVGDGTTANALTPKVAPLGGAASAVATGGSHACAVLANRTVSCWGANGSGQVTGTSSGAPVPSPTVVQGISGATAVAAGGSYTCAIVANGAVQCWGAITPAQPIPSGARSLTAGKSHACAVVGGAVQCWGANTAGQLGATASGAGVAVPIPSGITAAGSVAAGADQTCAATGTSRLTTPDDSVRCWGDSVGPGWLPAAQQTTPAIPLKSNGDATIRFDVDFMAVGGHHACVHRSAEFVECFGANESGQLGGGPIAGGETITVTLPAGATGLAAGASHTCASLADGSIRCWGANDAGQLGDGTTNDAPSPITPAGG